MVFHFDRIESLCLEPSKSPSKRCASTVGSVSFVLGFAGCAKLKCRKVNIIAVRFA